MGWLIEFVWRGGGVDDLIDGENAGGREEVGMAFLEKYLEVGKVLTYLPT